MLDGVAATPGHNAWAVGTIWALYPPITLIAHWNGHAWEQVNQLSTSAVSIADQLSSGLLAWVAREPYAGPKNTTTAKSSVMSWNRCASPAGTNRADPGPTATV